RAAPAEQERHAERHRGQRVGRVVQGVAEQRNRAGQHDHGDLDERGRGQPGQRDPQGAQALGRVFQYRVDRTVVIVRVRPDRVPDAGPYAPVSEGVAVAVLMRVIVVVVMAVVLAVPVLVAVLISGRARVVLAAHLPSMARKTRCRTSISATRVRLRTPRSYGPGLLGPADNRAMDNGERLTVPH